MIFDNFFVIFDHNFLRVYAKVLQGPPTSATLNHRGREVHIKCQIQPMAVNNQEGKNLTLINQSSCVEVLLNTLSPPLLSKAVIKRIVSCFLI